MTQIKSYQPVAKAVQPLCSQTSAIQGQISEFQVRIVTYTQDVEATTLSGAKVFDQRSVSKNLVI